MADAPAPRIRPLPPQEARGGAAKALASPVGDMTIFRILAHAQTNIVPVMKLGGAILSDQQLDARSRELMLLALFALEGGRYEWAQHVEIALDAGITEQEITGIQRGDFQSGFSPRDQALLKFTETLISHPNVPGNIFSTVREFLDEREIIEAIIAIGYYMMLVRLTESVDLGAEAVNGRNVILSLADRPLLAPAASK
ncbi:carboxymuconolactone decarboxylase family protein [Novosphingobium sp. BL-52-GroH]|uniref:carboxymuconolactone decarboxylase family protein n=1 Tax=Novosphingobium sp. BL-52-GroH TaxID=3349877 RepID=UPI00384C534F